MASYTNLGIERAIAAIARASILVIKLGSGFRL